MNTERELYFDLYLSYNNIISYTHKLTMFYFHLYHIISRNAYDNLGVSILHQRFFFTVAASYQLRLDHRGGGARLSNSCSIGKAVFAA